MKLSISRSVALVGLICWSCGGSNPVAPPVTTPPPSTPKPDATPTPVAKKSCTLPEMPDNDNCAPSKKNPNVYLDQVRGAIAILRQQKPDFFEGDLIRQETKYVDGLIRVLEEEYGLCGGRNGKDELKVKGDNKFNEHYDVIAIDKYGDPYVNWTYTATCTPANF